MHESFGAGMPLAAPATSQQDVGRVLRRARQRHHVPLEEAADVTRIPKRYLEALEDNAPLDTYPAPVYARAFLREYARFLDVDPEPLMARFGATPPDEVPLTSMREVLPPPRRWPARVLVALSVGTLVGLAVVGVLADRGRVPASGLGANAAALPTTPPPAHEHGNPPLPPIRGIQAKLHITDRCWVQAVADGQTIFRGTLLAGQSKVLHADGSLRLTLGNAGGAELWVNRHSVSTGTISQVLHLSLAREGHRVTVTRA